MTASLRARPPCALRVFADSCESKISPSGKVGGVDRAQAGQAAAIKNRCPTAAGIRYIGALNTDMVIIRSVAAVTALGA